MKYKKIFSGITVAIGMLMASQAQDWNGGGSTSVDLWRDGNVGIGLSSNPTYKLELDNGDMNILNGYGVKFGSIYGIRPASSSSPNFILGNGGMFGVGISPNYKLDVDGDLNLNTGVLRFGSAEAFTRLGSDFILGNSGGMFGVGITPAYKLDVDGDLNLNTGVFRLAGYEAFTLTGSDFILGNSGGMFGVGITPAYKLDVDGDVNIPSTFSYKIDGNNYLSYKGTSNILLGYEAGNALNIVGGTNIPSERNIFIGDNAGKLTEYSYNNIFIGHSSGFIQNSPSNLIGGNTFLGNSTGTNNNGYSNTFIGYLSGNDNIGNGNTFLGRESGVNYANFTSNVSNSVFVGKDAGQDLNTGNLISLLGYEATSADGLTNATAIGANAFVNQSNSLILGNNALVGIGNSAPQYTHHVTGGQRIEWHSLIGDLDGSSFNSVGGEGRLTVNSATSTSAFSGDNTTPFSHFFTKAGLFISHAGGNKSHGVHGIARVFSTDESAPSYAIGVEGEAYAGCETKGIGVKGEAYNNSVNVGIAGFGGTANELDCESNINIGVYGEADDQTPGATNYDYAAYNNGTVNVVGSLYTLSDEKFKSDITLFDNNIKKRFLDLRPVSYNYKYSEYPEMKFDKNPGLGFIAQEVEKVFPELVKNNLHPSLNEQTRKNIQYKSINYISLIPVLTHVLQDEIRKAEMMQAEIDELKSKLNAINKGNVNPSQLEDDLLKKSKLGENVLYQNQPNPFKETSTINYFIANNASLAYIYIFDLRGAMLKSIKIDQFGNGNIKLTGGDLKAGMYLYSLIVDGEEIDTKRMILLD